MAVQHERLTPREREVLRRLQESGGRTVHQVRRTLERAPGASAVRAVLLRLLRKGLVVRTTGAGHRYWAA